MNVGLEGYRTNIREALMNRLLAIGAADRPHLDLIAVDNIGFTPPEPTTAWWRVTIIPGARFPATVGTPTVERELGTMLVELFLPINTGTEPAEVMADAICGLFGMGSIVWANGQSVRIRRTYCSRPPAEPTWYRMSVTVEWQADILIAT